MRNLILNGVASTLNVLGRALVFSYDVCACSVGKVCDVVRKAPDAIGKVGDITRKASVATKKVLGLQQQGKPAGNASGQSATKAKGQESTMKNETTREEEEPPTVNDSSLLTPERLNKMVKPQLLSLCDSLKIECNYTESKAQIIAKILERKKA